jgi:phospholipid/cholesterol/gamma-HCH transport system substrate-binding protein
VRRALVVLGLVTALGAYVVLTSGLGRAPDDTYWVELDNAFGLIQGGDLKVAGVRAGHITAIRLDKRTKHALVGFRIDKNGFGSLRRDVHCESRPQSLIGEYFLECLPGTARRKLKPGARIPVRQTASTIAPDLVNDILREPERDRLRIIISELGAGVAGRGPELNAAIRRAIPALRETDQVLALLGEQNRTLQDLTVNADTVVGDLAANRRDVGRFVTKADDTAQASAERRPQIADGLRRLPGFLVQLQPTMKSLGEVADRQTPALQNLDASARQITDFFDRLGPFAEASRPAIRSLGHASVTGDRAARAAGPTVSLLNGVARGTPEVAKDLSMILGHLDDRRYAIEKDPRSPGGQGYTGLEALLQYVYDQTTSTAVYDRNSHIFKVALFASECANYADAKTVKDNPSLMAKCGSYLGPDQPGITTEDVTRFSDPRSDTARSVARRRNDPAAAPTRPDAPSLPVPDPRTPANEPAPSAPTLPGVGGAGGVQPPSVKVPPVTPPTVPGASPVPNLPIPCVPPLRPPACTPNTSAPAASPPSASPPASAPPVQIPGVTGRTSAAAPSPPQGSGRSQQLLDYLLKP